MLVLNEPSCYHFRVLDSRLPLRCDNSSLLTRQSEPPALVLNDPSCYHFRVLDPRVAAMHSATLSATRDALTIGRCSHI